MSQGLKGFQSLTHCQSLFDADFPLIGIKMLAIHGETAEMETS